MANRKRKPLSQVDFDENESQRSSKKTRNDDEQQGPTRRAGTINHIILKNFMCHSLLEVKFVNNISMVIGKNGSGKSAILTALVIGLGGKASTTNRGKSVKGFVKAGKTSGSIEIELCNEGPMAYRPAVYGNCILITRTLSANGGGSYKIRSEKGEIISTQAKEIHNITTALNIQIDNPVCILNQDTSRNFLSSTDPKQKFALFVRATQLDQLADEYKKIEVNKNEATKTLSEKEENFRKLHDEMKKLKRKIDTYKSVGTLKDRKHLLERELAWAKVRDVEEVIEKEQSNVQKWQTKYEEFKSSTEKKQNNFNSLKTQTEETKMKIMELGQEIEVQKRPQVDVKAEVDQLYQKYRNKKVEKVQAQTALESKVKDMKTLESEIASSKENMSKVEQQKMEKIKNLTNLQNKLKGMNDHLETAKNDLFQINSDLPRKEEEEENLRGELRQLDHKLNEHRNNLNALQGESGDVLMLYGRDMPKVKQMIAQCRRQFQQEPRGPLGSYIKLKDKKWAVAVEGFIGPGTLGAFTVDNKHDCDLLRKIFNKVWTSGVQPQVITSKFIFRKHDVSRNLTAEPDDCTSLYNVLEIEDPIVYNCIVDNISPENILLLPDDVRAQELLAYRERVPRNCHQGITARGDRYYPDPNYRTYGSRYRKAQYLQVDRKEYMRQLQISIENLTSKRKTIANQLESFQRDLREQIRQKSQLEEKMRKVNAARNQIKRQLEELTMLADPETHDVQYLEQELEEVKKAISEKKSDLERVVVELKEIKERIAEKESHLTKLQQSTRGLEDRIQALKNEVRECETKSREITTADEFDKRRLNELKTHLNSALAEVKSKENVLKKLVDEARQVGDRMSDLRQVATINNDINEIKHRIDNIEKDKENVIDIMEHYNELSEKYTKSAEMMKTLRKDLNELTLAMEKRSRHYKLTEVYFITHMKMSFEKVLSARQFNGTLEIDMEKKKLDLVVMPEQGSQGQTTTSNLSGGERSFSTIAFLYSLWQCMEFPFYFLDEFDVYMDKLNRTKVINILLNHAKMKPQLQFVFLTPQDVSFISDDVSILRLENPERNNA